VHVPDGRSKRAGGLTRRACLPAVRSPGRRVGVGSVPSDEDPQIDPRTDLQIGRGMASALSSDEGPPIGLGTGNAPSSDEDLPIGMGMASGPSSDEDPPIGMAMGSAPSSDEDRLIGMAVGNVPTSDGDPRTDPQAGVGMGSVPSSGEGPPIGGVRRGVGNSRGRGTTRRGKRYGCDYLFGGWWWEMMSSVDGASQGEGEEKKKLIEEGFDYVYGVAPALNALLGKRRSIEEIFMQEVGALAL
jgi:hypothetical protein